MSNRCSHFRVRAMVLSAMCGLLLPGFRGSAASAPAVDAMALRGLKRAPTHDAVPEPDWGTVLVSLHVLAHTRDGDGMVQEGATLHTGEQIELHVRVGRPAYVSLFQVAPDGKAEPLYPAAGEPERLEPGVEGRMPTDPGISFELNEIVGTEQVVLIASERRLSEQDEALLGLLRSVRQRGRLPVVKLAGERSSAGARPKRRARPVAAAGVEKPSDDDDSHFGPTRATEILRGFRRGRTLDSGSSGRALDLQPDASGVAVAILRYKHLP